METPRLQASHLLIGRDRERKLLHRALSEVSQGRGKFALVAGEAGIGKTTLTMHLLRDASGQGFSILRGYCYDLETTPPYGPWRELLRGTGIDVPDPGSPVRGETAAAEQHGAAVEEVHADIVRGIRQLAADRPLALVLEDVHWSDQTSLDLMRRLARRLTDVPILLIATYRDLDLVPELPLYSLLPHLVRESVTLRVTLQPLQREAMRQLIRSRYELSNSDEVRLASHIASHAEGNPFFIEELLNDLEYRGVLEEKDEQWSVGDLDTAPVPPLVQQVIDGRLDRLRQRTRELLEIAAIIGDSVPVDLWQKVADADDDELASALGDALSFRVLEEDHQKAAFRFHHALVRQALYENLLLPRRRHWHLRIGQTLASQQDADPITVAHHLWLARDAVAMEWLLTAGEQSARVHAPNAAVEQFSRALELADELALPPPEPALRGRGEAYALLGAFDEAHTDFQRLLDMTRDAGDTDLEWRCLIDMGTLWSSRDYQRSGSYFQRAMELAEQAKEPTLLAHSLTWFGNWLLNTGEPIQAIECHRRALMIFEEITDTEGIATTNDMLALDHIIRGDLVRSRERSIQASRLFEQLEQPAQVALALLPLVPIRGVYEFASEVPVRESHPDPQAVADRVIRTARSIPWRAGEAAGRIALGSHLALHGEFGAGLESATAGLELALEIEHREWIALGNIVLGFIHLDLLDLHRAIEHLERAYGQAVDLSSFVHVHLATAPLIEAYLAAGDPVSARKTLDSRGIDRSRTATSVERSVLRSQAELLIAEGDTAQALELIDAIIAATPNIEPPHATPPLSIVRARALAELENFDEADLVLERADIDAHEAGRTPIRWWLLANRAGVLREKGRQDQAARLLADSRRIIQQLASTLPDEATGKLYIERASKLLPGLEPDNTASLSERELEVLRLAAQGLTNGEIAEQLFISPRTVKGHLQSIYNKLGVNTRTAAATAAIELKLL
ncbi:MAG: helix-turn-helix transcriptional regulator [Chloroflexota bacterium]